MFADVIARLRGSIEADGKVDLEETGLLLRTIRPFVRMGDASAIHLERLLLEVREDGVITSEESGRVLKALEDVSKGVFGLKGFVREIPDFPKPGVLFRDVTGILESGEGFRLCLAEMQACLADTRVDLVVAPESRGFIFGAALADRLGVAFVPIRKPGKLPRETVSEDYDLEYGAATLHMHKDAIVPGERVVVVDDLLATGGTALAAARLVERLGGTVVKMIFPIELEGFGARHGLLADYDVCGLIRYPGT